MALADGEIIMRHQAHMFVDNSNIIGGAQKAAMDCEGAPWPAVRVYWRNFFQLIESDYLPVTRVLAGSLPPGNEKLWEYARKYGYDTSLLKRVRQDNGRLAEQAVDEVMHAKIAGVLLDYEPPQTLVLATGDGAEGKFGTSFLQQVQRALKRGWCVDVYSWKRLLSHNFLRLAKRQPDKIKVIELEKYYSSITFIREGAYRQKDGSTLHVAERIVDPLPDGR
jgi:hypothetical protein